ncbi:MAG: hypothetical protein JNJ95_08540 [Dechloromonas sp.]|nr:hypothetical protein [Dechloromonas sp.]
MTIVVTGAGGFIGCNLVFGLLAQSDEPVDSFDDLSYASNLDHGFCS